MKKMLTVVTVAVSIGITLACQSSKGSRAALSVEMGKPYANYQDLQARRLPDDGFLMTAFQLESDNTIDLSFYTHGKPEDKELIEPTIEEVKYLTQNLTKEHPIHVVFVDGNPKMKVNDQPVGTGDVIREITLPITN